MSVGRSEGRLSRDIELKSLSGAELKWISEALAFARIIATETDVFF